MTPETIKISIASLADSSLRQYDSALKKWWNFCSLTNTAFFSAEITDILKFLTREFENGASYGTINSLRSAIALILGPEIGENTNVKRFCKGVSRLRPVRPKYDVTWDPKIVLDFLSKWYPNDTISLQQLSEKLATLLALTTGHRIQTLIAIDIKNITKSEKQIEIKIPAQLKTSGPRKVQPNLILPFYSENPSICVASTLLVYLERSNNLRQNITNLFISWKKPHKAVTTQSLSRWIKNTLQESGLDTSIFSAYSTRHASTSAANRNGVNIDLIRKTAGWTPASQTFNRFYNLQVTENRDTFAKTILKL